ncbi:transcriptional repressor [Amaricoccus sp.]|uniref:transcriptional repressor n=1 Tax=Amaricoccus sp. TaxID=1872485 RepID=UPI001B5688EF|nr:transcriptional repressor [Amaricoccus sp.]MBP7000928.1 transcriptional repressor [Amaricoccus sp.]
MNPSTADLRAFAAHDHAHCRSRALAAAEERCRARRLRLTPARATALEALLESHRAMTAYELLDRLREAGHGGQPPVVYRALAFLVENGFAHRIERLGAYVACTGEGAHPAAFMVCRACRAVAETALDVEPGLAERASAFGFVPERTVVEVEGLCARCAATAAA